jgi:hypothetical protein
MEVSIPDLIKGIQMNWSNKESDNRVANYMAQLKYTLKKHSIDIKSLDLKDFIDHNDSITLLNLE